MRQRRANSKFYPEVQVCGNLNIVNWINQHLTTALTINESKISKVSSIFLFRKVGTPATTVLHYLYSDAAVYLDRKYEKALLGLKYVNKRKKAN